MVLVEILDAFTTPRTAEAAARLLFEYLAATQAEAGLPEPATVEDLNPALEYECRNLAQVYRTPGTLLLAYHDGRAIGCVGVVSRGLGTAEIKRLYVRQAERGGIGRLLVGHAHRHAAHHWFTRVVVSVEPGHTAAIEFYRRLGYTDAEPYDMSPMSMVHLQRPITPA
ncbi:GNAT family N-acetyltransferase [Actinophytocola algeriensis]|jgi:ribosomal protein S18 acetylase RimI-like enzyme|uniref:Ribosomal protein S18 acetylase RimI-like enzyme n=1 Tax=Actinophytocola algeriensis TaxID=1768010 RepID=A0A7W7VJ10_9PSEU|nr:GNAT family N-acetyltransferase [Actinophytocola algeriensis]MBB4912132.1 ribosomal protein S18 acetylase RimI-like enzyme [Actinophytocola algeriensis]MBE1477376.1 ribosomal protein S18 acetylase RimI-like enzyme [Actinophytocola algeriensis]